MDDSIASLIAAHPNLFAGASPDESWDVQLGWRNLVNQLCVNLGAVRAQSSPPFRVVQIREKLGQLRILLEADGDTVLPPEAARVLVIEAMHESIRLCQVCGMSAMRTSTRGFQYRTLCPAHLPSTPGR